jgi:O-antigen/teichoic acid export membrane protein
MSRALTIRFGLLFLGAAALDIALNILRPEPGLGGAALVTYILVAGGLVARYCVTHEDEIPSRPPRDTPRR